MKITNVLRRLRQLAVAGRAAVSPSTNGALHLLELVDAARRAQLPVIELAELLRRLRGTSAENATVIRPQAIGEGSGSTAEMVALASITAAIRPKRILEFGTFNGASAWHLLANAADDCIVTTVDLPAGINVGGSTDPSLQGAARCRPFLPDDPRVRLVEVDSRSWVPDISDVDLCFIDAGHSYECVKNDTEKALTVMRPSGLVVWHDAVWRRDQYGVNRYLRELRGAGHDVRLLRIGPYDYCGIGVRLPSRGPAAIDADSECSSRGPQPCTQS